MAIRFTTINGSQKVWMARVAYRGQRISKVCRTKDEARDAEGELRRQLKADAAQAEQAGQRPATIKQLFEFYVTDLEARGKGPETTGRAAETAKAVERLTPELLAMAVGKLRDREVFDFRQARTRDGAKPSTINRDLRTLRAMLNQARPEFRFPGGAFFPEDETRVRWLRPEEELLVLETMPSPFREMSKLAALTLMRQGELRLLRKEAVHLEQGVILLPRAKAGARPVVLSEAARKILVHQLEHHPKSEWVFPGPGGSPYSRVHVSRVFRKASRGAGLRDFHFHDLRHHGATMALNKGFTAPIVMALGGWKTERMMRRQFTSAACSWVASTNATTSSGRERVTHVPGLRCYLSSRLLSVAMYS
jgi:integrase